MYTISATRENDGIVHVGRGIIYVQKNEKGYNKDIKQIKEEITMKKRRKLLGALLCTVLSVSMLAGCGSTEAGDPPAGEESDSNTNSDQEQVQKPEEDIRTISLLAYSDMELPGLEAVCELAEEKLGIHVDIEIVSANDEIVQVRAAAGELNDVVLMNSGAVLSTVHPEEYFMPLNDEAEIMEKLDENYIQSVTLDGVTYGIPQASSQAGCVLYNKEMYEKYQLEVPKTWDEFVHNCKVLEENGETPLIGAFGDAWTSQVLMLGDFYNLNAADPNFVENYSAGKAKYADNENALKSFAKYEDVLDFYNEDYLSTTYDDGCQKLADGEGAHWIMLTQVLGNIYSLYGEEVTNKIGAFAIPSEDANVNGLTVWMPNSVYGNKQSENADAVLEFMKFYLSDEALNAFTAAQPPVGPYCVKGYEIPDDAYEAVRVDMQSYFDQGTICSAMEFMTSVKGNNAEKICQEVASGLTTGIEAAEKYDEDSYKCAIQLGLDWER